MEPPPCRNRKRLPTLPRLDATEGELEVLATNLVPSASILPRKGPETPSLVPFLPPKPLVGEGSPRTN